MHASMSRKGNTQKEGTSKRKLFHPDPRLRMQKTIAQRVFEHQEQELDEFKRTYRDRELEALVRLVLEQEFGFGKVRLGRFVAALDKLVEVSENGKKLSSVKTFEDIRRKAAMTVLVICLRRLIEHKTQCSESENGRFKLWQANSLGYHLAEQVDFTYEKTWIFNNEDSMYRCVEIITSSFTPNQLIFGFGSAFFKILAENVDNETCSVSLEPHYDRTALNVTEDKHLRCDSMKRRLMGLDDSGNENSQCTHF